MKYDKARIHMFRVPENAELVENLTKYAVKNRVRTGWINVLGSVIDPVLGYYDKARGEYLKNKLEGFYELVNGTGNISLKNDEPTVHLHVAIADRNSHVYGGHLFEARVFMVEALIIEALGDKFLVRRNIGGNLWAWD